MADRLLFEKTEDQNLNLLLSLPGRPHPDPGLFFPGARPPILDRSSCEVRADP